VDFTDAELEAIERACSLQARREREMAAMVDRPMLRNHREDSAAELERIASALQLDRKRRALTKRCPGCDD
jgi:hypothetical protein